MFLASRGEGGSENMSTSVDDIQSRVAAVVDQNEDTDDIQTSDYSLRLKYINRRERMWSEIGKWQSLYKEYNCLASTSTGNCSVALPDDFRMIASSPKITYDGTNTNVFPEIRGQEEARFSKASDKYVKVLGNKHSGFTLVVNPATTSRQMASGASINVPYFSVPTSHASPSNVVICPNPDYLVQGTIADIWEAREDARFQGAKVEANLILQNMMEFENTPSEAAYDDRVRTVDQARSNFRWGE